MSLAFPEVMAAPVGRAAMVVPGKVGRMGYLESFAAAAAATPNSTAGLSLAAGATRYQVRQAAMRGEVAVAAGGQMAAMPRTL